MATDLILPGGVRPSNLHLPERMNYMQVDTDLYGICEEMKKIDPNLYVLVLDDGTKYGFAIMEHCKDGVERLVFKVRELDQRVLKKLADIMSVPLRVRIRQLERANHRFEEQERERDLEELYERMGRPMWTQLEHDGFVQRGVSYPKRGVTGGRGSAKKS